MLEAAANTDLFNSLVPKAHNSVKIYYFILNIMEVFNLSALMG